MNSILKITMWLLLFAGLLVLVGFMEVSHKHTICKAVDIRIDYRESDPLIEEKDIAYPIFKRFDTLVGKKLSDINSTEIENLVNAIDFIESAEVYSTLTGVLKVKATQRIPVLRVVNHAGQNFYIDRNGSLFPVKTGFGTRILVANGYIKTRFSDTLQVSEANPEHELFQLKKLANFIAEDEFLKAQIEQIYVNSSGEYELVPKVGRQLILFGDIEGMEQKFEKLKIFYKEGMKRAGWDAYKTISLKFENQVVCEKK